MRRDRNPDRHPPVSARLPDRSGGRAEGRLRPLRFGLALLAATSRALAQEPAAAPASAPVLTIGEALRSALARNPELLDAADALASARWNERGIASTFLPQVSPF